ncbi:MAG TPA: hypothetical protein VIK14_05980 [Ignavibacteria bacterium]
METKSRNRILYLLLVGLVMMNLVTLGFLWMYKFKEHRQIQQPPPPPPAGKILLEQELRFSKEQAEKFDKLRNEHSTSARKIVDDIAMLKENLFETIKENGGDDSKATKIADEIGNRQKELDLITYNHFKDIRNLCDEKQRERFDLILKDISKMIGPQNPPGQPPGLPVHPPPMK